MSNKKKPVKYKDKVYPSLPELCRVVESPVSFFCVRSRLKSGWTLDDALTTPKLCNNRSTIKKSCMADLASHKIKSLIEYCIEISNSIELLGVDEDEYRSRFGY